MRSACEALAAKPGPFSTAFPLAHHVVALGDEIGGAPEVEVGERGTERGGELAHLVTTAAGCVQGVLEADVGGGEFVDDGRVELLAPELGEPAPDDGLVLFP